MPQLTFVWGICLHQSILHGHLTFSNFGSSWCIFLVTPSPPVRLVDSVIEGTPNHVIVYDTTLRPHREETRRCIASHWCWGRADIATWSHSGAVLGVISFLYKSKKTPSFLLSPLILRSLYSTVLSVPIGRSFQVPGSPFFQVAPSTATSRTPSLFQIQSRHSLFTMAAIIPAFLKVASLLAALPQTATNGTAVIFYAATPKKDLETNFKP